MCGIAGFINPDLDRASIKINIDNMGLNIKHRGPDYSGFYIDDKVSLALVSTRLSIQDLTKAGNQPMISSSRRYVIIFNGEIYNFKKLNNIFSISSNKNFSDTFVFLELIDRFGLEKALSLVEGMFAFAIWDSLKKRLILCRDRIGEKPLYYGWSSNKFVFASEITSIASLSFFNNSVSRDAVDLFLKYSCIPHPFSIYEKIFKLEPGSFIYYYPDSNQVKEKKYWSIFKESKLQKNSIINKDPEKILDNLLNEKIKDQMLSDAPLGVFLSSGIDSSLVAAIMQKNSDNKIETFSLGFEDKNFDESQSAKAIANYIGSNHNQVFLNKNNMIETALKIPILFDEPFADSSQIPTYILSNFASKKVKVVLSGDGADELFAGYNKYLLLSKYYNLFNNLPLFAKKLLKYSTSNSNLNKIFSEIINFSKILPNVNFNSGILDKFNKSILQNNLWDLYIHLLSVFKEDDGLFMKKNIIDMNKYFNQINFDNNLEKMTLFDTSFMLPSDILCKVDRSSMLNSLEVRCPFLNHEIFNFSYKLNKKEKIFGNETKYILKKILYNYVPKNFFTASKKGFGVPIETWLRNDLKPYVNDAFNSKILQNFGFNKTMIIKLWDNFLNKKNNNYNQIWTLFTLCVWLENNKKRILYAS
jgi:asparagine synthase (glutamine-hydrolysing)